MAKSKKIRLEPKKKSKLKNVFASMRSRLIHEPKPVTLPEIKALTLEEIEKKYGDI